MRLADSLGLSVEVRQSLVALIELSAPTAIETDPSKWLGYCIKPLTAIPMPDARLAPEFADILEVQLDFEIERQSKEYGVWSPHWSWGSNYPEAWPQAQKHWSGIITLEALRSLDAFGRLA